MKKGVIFINIGSPEAPTAAALKPYLRKFLMDPYVLQMPFVFRWILVNLIIVPFRARFSAEKYKAIWTPEGSPLLALSRRMDTAVREKLPDFFVKTAMLNSEPSLKTVLQECRSSGVEEVLCFPLFPQYAESTSVGAEVLFREAVRKHYPKLKFRVHGEFFEEPGFIAAWKSVILDKFGLTEAGAELPVDHVLFSFHGLPESHLRKNPGCLSDSAAPGVATMASGNSTAASQMLQSLPSASQQGLSTIEVPLCCQRPEALTEIRCYRAQSLRTAQKIAESLELKNPCSVSFQSRLGRAAWIGPATDAELKRLAQSGVRRLVIIGPSFIVDGLETLEEINIEMREIFLANGGQDFHFVSSLNASIPWIDWLTKEVKNSLI